MQQNEAPSPQSPTTDINSFQRTLIIIWGGLLFAQFIFLVVGYTTKPNLIRLDRTKPILGDDPVPVIVLAICALSLFTASFAVRNMLIAAAIKARDLKKLQTAHVVGMAMAETISIIGIIAAFIFNYQYFAAFILLAVISIILQYPRTSDILSTSFKDKI